MNPTRTGLLIIAHGSQAPQAAEEMAQLTSGVLAAAGRPLAFVKVGYLRHLEPNVPEALDWCVGEGVDELLVLPWLLNSGRHVLEDVPRFVEQARARHPGVCLRLLPHIGAHEGLPELIGRMLACPGSEIRQ